MKTVLVTFKTKISMSEIKHIISEAGERYAIETEVSKLPTKLVSKMKTDYKQKYK